MWSAYAPGKLQLVGFLELCTWYVGFLELCTWWLPGAMQLVRWLPGAMRLVCWLPGAMNLVVAWSYAPGGCLLKLRTSQD